MKHWGGGGQGLTIGCNFGLQDNGPVLKAFVTFGQGAQKRMSQ